MSEIETTQRAYTLRLRGVDIDDQAWRDALWATHEAVNNGAKVFGDWLLTFRGGLDHRLADDKVPSKGKPDRDPTPEEGDRQLGPHRVDDKGKPDRDPTPEERKDRHILLALSWLSVEDAHGAPQDENLIVARGTDDANSREQSLREALGLILASRGLSERETAEWVSECTPSLSAAIREDAVWVNRSVAFGTFLAQCSGFSRDEVWDFLAPFFSAPSVYLQPAKADSDKVEGGVDAGAKQEKAKDLVQKAGGWLSKRMGTGEGANFAAMATAYKSIADWAKTASEGAPKDCFANLALHLQCFKPRSVDSKGVLSVISGPGYKSATRNRIKSLASQGQISREELNKLEELALDDSRKCHDNRDGKGPRPYATTIIQSVERACGFTYRQAGGPARHREFSVMLDHAARRVNVAHSSIKNAEAERRQFERDAQRLGDVPKDALAWLERYCDERGRSSGALDGYLIRKRAIDAWEQIVEHWSRSGCKSAEDRISAARRLQDDPEIDKFGDIQLFEALAADEAACVWKTMDDPSTQHLRNFVASSEAAAKRRRFKVPSYRHPDPLRHPVFVDFGNSRWEIDFSAHRAPTTLDCLARKVEQLTGKLAKAEEKCAAGNSARNESSVKKANDVREKLRQARMDLAAVADAHRVKLRLRIGCDVKTIDLRWSCKRLVADLALEECKGTQGNVVGNVPRADRLGRALLGSAASKQVAVEGLFEHAHWNGRLQAPRSQLDIIARHVDAHGWDAKARKKVDHLRWLVTFSAELTPNGPWCEFANRHRLKPDPKYWPHSEANQKRQGHARLVLCRLPGLRVISVDLGHRFAAACAVWEAVSTDRVRVQCEEVGIPAPLATAMYLHVSGTGPRGNATTTIFRRIGPDNLPDGTPHPAPWARLDRQFLIKLQGEDRSARKASPEEISAVDVFEQWGGLCRTGAHKRRSLRVDWLMSSAVRTARLALARHGRRASIARNLLAKERVLPGARRFLLDDAGRLSLLAETLVEWHGFATDGKWDDAFARRLWNDQLAGLRGGFEIHGPSLIETLKESTSTDRRIAEKVVRAQLQPLAEALAGNAPLRCALNEAWVARWQTDDERWRRELRWLARWIMPRGKAAHKGERWSVGGLSITRIATLTEFRRKVQVGYFTRVKPDGNRAEIGARFGQGTLNAIEHLKENRIKQLASRIVEAALGIGIERNGERDLSRPRERIQQSQFAPCHAVVIEDLSHYRPEETKTRRENRATMDWKSAETRKRLEDHCHLYGLHLRDVNPQYTSRQDSRTGAPGWRCIEVTVGEFLSAAMWRKQVSAARKKTTKGQGDARERYLAALDDKWSQATEKEKILAHLRIPLKGGDLFVSVQSGTTKVSAIQADLNAAANIGLRALIDPDFPGKWWYVPCEPKTGHPVPEKVKGGILDNVGQLFVPPETNAEKKTTMKKTRRKVATKQREVVNQWRDPEATAIRGIGSNEVWRETSSYWNAVQSRVIQLLCKEAEIPPV